MADVIGVGGHDGDGFRASQRRGGNDDRRVDHIGGTRSSSEKPRGPGGQPIKGRFMAMAQGSGEQCLSSPVAPGLSNGSGRHLHDAARLSCDSEHRPGTAVIAVERDEGAGVEHQSGGHGRSRLRARASSSSLRAPCSDSQSATTARRPRVASRRRAASANQADTFCESASAAARTAVASSASNDTVTRSTATPGSYLFILLEPRTPTTRARPVARARRAPADGVAHRGLRVRH